ncbi:class I SAM-dependent methyltransferase [Ramlibacter humi]|uniref:Class I SAM-dependent methyltransferase n=1 Tax=Ramlibacter humi TaxID=2530451 RepID=A0A4Z0BWV9_9BURK|nr:class I SAM-dependent methyltransferase [Ramlibacter humi]TFZ03816.1 class I SAM-dependent methyltransferase [Ramlibacter humi]
MSQITTGIRACLNLPALYTAFQYAMGARSGWTYLARTHIRARPGDAILDIGCGPADILGYLPPVKYWGFDIDPGYIDSARRRFGENGTFTCKELSPADVAGLEPFDIVLATGVLHHMDDAVATGLLSTARAALKPGGRLVTIDPVFADGQSRIARLLIENDRGQNVRTKEGYEQLMRRRFDDVRVLVRHRRWIPYTHCIMEATATP